MSKDIEKFLELEITNKVVFEKGQDVAALVRKAEELFVALEKVCPVVRSNAYSQDSYSIIHICFRNTVGSLPPPGTSFGGQDIYWENPSVLGISEIGGIATIRSDKNLFKDDASVAFKLIEEFGFIFVPWEVLDMVPSEGISITDGNSWYETLFDYY